MQTRQYASSAPYKPYNPSSPTDSLGKHIRWQILLVLAGLILLVILLGYSTYNVSTVLVPDSGGVFREGIAGNPQYMNPLLCKVNDVDLDICALLYRGLTRIDKQGRVVPDLASGWTISNGLNYVFRLKQDQYWHDGQPVTADDVIFTIGVLQDPEMFNLPGLASLWRSVEVKKIDDYTVQFSLREPFTPFLDYTGIGLLPKHIWEETPAAELATKTLDSTPIGNGPLRVVETSPDQVRLEPSPYYAGPSPYLSALELRFYPDHPSLLAAFAVGEIDGISRILPADIAMAAEREDLQLFSSVQSEYLTIVLNLNNPDVPFFQDKLVRQALYYGIDREGVIEDVLGGQGIIAHSLLLPENWAYNPDVRRYEYDPELANRLLDEAGWIDSDGDGVRDQNGQPLQFLLHTNDESSRVGIIERIAEDWQKLGIRVVASPVTFSGLVGDLLAPRRFDAVLIGWELEGDPDPYPLWHSTQLEGGGQNYGGWSNAVADGLLEEARAITDMDERKALYAEFQEIFTEELPALLLFHPVYTYGVSDEVHNVQIGSLNQPAERFETFADWYMITRRVPAGQVGPDVPLAPPSGLEQDAGE